MIEKLELRNKVDIVNKINEIIYAINDIQSTHIGGELEDIKQKRSYDEQIRQLEN